MPIPGRWVSLSMTVSSSAGRRAAAIRKRHGDSSPASGSPTRSASNAPSTRSSARSRTSSRRCATGHPGAGRPRRPARCRPDPKASAALGRSRTGAASAQGADLPPRTRGTPARHHSCRQVGADCKGHVVSRSPEPIPPSRPIRAAVTCCGQAGRLRFLVAGRLIGPVPDRRLPRTPCHEPETRAQHARDDQHCRPPPHAVLRSTVVRAFFVSHLSRPASLKVCAGPAKDLRPHIGGEGDANRRPGTVTIRHEPAGTFQIGSRRGEAYEAASGRDLARAERRRDTANGSAAASQSCPHANRARPPGGPPLAAAVETDGGGEPADGDGDRDHDDDDGGTHGCCIGRSPRRLNGTRCIRPVGGRTGS